MQDRMPGPITRRWSLEEENRSLYMRTVELERRLMRFEREEKAFREIERSYLDLMDSEVFLLLLLDVQGGVLAANRCAERLWQLASRDGGAAALGSMCAFADAEKLDSLLRQAARERVRARLSLLRANGSQVWVEAELSPSLFRGGDAIQLIGVDVTEKVEAARPQGARDWGRVLDACPGLLCCVLDAQGRLIYVSRGYRAAAKRFLGHDCVVGAPYPPEANSADRSLHDLLASALLGGMGGIELRERHEEGDRFWEMLASPLRSEEGEVAGAVLRMSPISGKRPVPVNDPALAEASSEVSDKGAFDGAAVLDAVSDMLLVADLQGNCLAVNESFSASLNLDPTALLGKPLTALPLANDPQNADFSGRLRELLNARSGGFEIRVGTSGGELVWLDVRGRPVDWNGSAAVLLTCTDVTLLRRTQEQLRRVAVTDRTTGLLNRQGMERVLVTELERAARYRGSLCLIIMDIDGFRRLNESRGYEACDRALKTLMKALKNILRPTDFLGRWGGDEFMVLTPQTSGPACLLADALRDTARNGVFDREDSISLSVGVAEFSREMDVSSFVGAAYDAMTAAKKDGGDRTVLAGGADRR